MLLSLRTRMQCGVCGHQIWADLGRAYVKILDNEEVN